jgi:hypothetical protein
MPLVRVRLRDVVTGDEAWHQYETAHDRDPDDDEGFWWTDGNAACDCERARCLAAALGRPDPNVPCGSARIVILEATIDGAPRPWHDTVTASSAD